MATAKYRIYFAERLEYHTIFRTTAATDPLCHSYSAKSIRGWNIGNCSHDLIGLPWRWQPDVSPAVLLTFLSKMNVFSHAANPSCQLNITRNYSWDLEVIGFLSIFRLEDSERLLLKFNVTFFFFFLPAVNWTRLCVEVGKKVLIKSVIQL